MLNYRATIKKMDEQQKQELERECQRLGIKLEISIIKPVGQPSKVDMRAFTIRYQDYLAGDISAPQLGAEFGLSKSGIYKKIEESKGLFKTRTHHKAEQNESAIQTSINTSTEHEDNTEFIDPMYEFEGFDESIAVSLEEQQDIGSDIFGHIDVNETLDDIKKQMEEEGV